VIQRKYISRHCELKTRSELFPRYSNGFLQRSRVTASSQEYLLTCRPSSRNVLCARAAKEIPRRVWKRVWKKPFLFFIFTTLFTTNYTDFTFFPSTVPILCSALHGFRAFPRVYDKYHTKNIINEPMYTIIIIIM